MEVWRRLYDTVVIRRVRIQEGIRSRMFFVPAPSRSLVLAYDDAVYEGSTRSRGLSGGGLGTSPSMIAKEGETAGYI